MRAPLTFCRCELRHQVPPLLHVAQLLLGLLNDCRQRQSSAVREDITGRAGQGSAGRVTSTTNSRKSMKTKIPWTDIRKEYLPFLTTNMNVKTSKT